MSEKDIQRLMELAKASLERTLTQEEALQELIDAGLVNPDRSLPQHLAELAQQD